MGFETVEWDPELAWQPRKSWLNDRGNSGPTSDDVSLKHQYWVFSTKQVWSVKKNKQMSNKRLLQNYVLLNFMSIIIDIMLIHKNEHFGSNIRIFGPVD